MKKKNAKKKIIATAVALVLLVACAVGATFAWFTDSTETLDNTFVVGNVDIVLYESNDGSVAAVTDKASATAQNKKYEDWLEKLAVDDTDATDKGNFLVPGRVVDKDVIVKNIGSNDAYIRIVVTVPLTVDDSLEFGKMVTVTDTYTVDRAEVDGNAVYTFTFDEALAPNAETVPVVETVKIKETAKQSDFNDLRAVAADGKFNITVKAYAIQAEGFATAAEAFAAVNLSDFETFNDNVAAPQA